MSEERFPILGTKIPRMVGRKDVQRTLWNELTKTTPSHRSLVGPRFSGKSVILNTFAERMRASDSLYNTVISWDLGHQTPRTDQEFLKQLCRKLGESLREAGNDYGDHLLDVSEGEYHEICEVLDLLHEDDFRILMLWDGFDRPLTAGTLTRNLWDNLLELCRKPSFRLVTASRRELHDLIRDEESVTSDFWGVFEVVRVRPFAEQDMEDAFACLEGYTFPQGARKELNNWSGGLPPLLLAILNQVVRKSSGGPVDNAAINSAAEAALLHQNGMLSDLWSDCSAGAKDLFILLSEQGEMALGDTGKQERAALIEKGFAVEIGQKLEARCRLLKRHIQGSGPDAGGMARLFGSQSEYSRNIRGLLEQRLAQIEPFEPRLHRLVEISIGFLPSEPDVAANGLTNIEERALDFIWKREFGTDRKIPSDIMSYWTEGPRDRNNLVRRLMAEDAWCVPSERGAQCGLLELLTGSRMGFEPKAKAVSKDVYTLINAIHSYRNRSEHGDGQEMSLGVAVAAIMTCIELLACLERDF